MTDDRPDGYFSGYANGIDHGIRLKANLREPVDYCTVDGESHAASFPANQVIYRGGNPVMHAGDFVTHG